MVLIGLWLCSPAPPSHSQTKDPERLNPAEDPATVKPLFSWAETTFDLSAGYRTDSLSWSIAGDNNGHYVNILSELKWSDLTIYQLKLSNRTVIQERFLLRGHLDFGVVRSGSNRDSDYDGDDRTLEFSRSINGVSGNDVWDGSIGIGPRFVLHDAVGGIGHVVFHQDAVAGHDINIVL